MIKELTIEDKNRFLYLGSLIKSGFGNTNDLRRILESESQYIVGYYENDKLVGFLYYSKSFDTIDIIDIVVDEPCRGRGIATELIKHVVNSYGDINTLFLEVNEKNKSAIRAYEKNGFQVISRRKKYYGRDDALIMKRDV